MCCSPERGGADPDASQPSDQTGGPYTSGDEDDRQNHDAPDSAISSGARTDQNVRRGATPYAPIGTAGSRRWPRDAERALSDTPSPHRAGYRTARLRNVAGRRPASRWSSLACLRSPRAPEPSICTHAPDAGCAGVSALLPSTGWLARVAAIVEGPPSLARGRGRGGWRHSSGLPWSAIPAANRSAIVTRVRRRLVDLVGPLTNELPARMTTAGFTGLRAPAPSAPTTPGT